VTRKVNQTAENIKGKQENGCPAIYQSLEQGEGHNIRRFSDEKDFRKQSSKRGGKRGGGRRALNSGQRLQAKTKFQNVADPGNVLQREEDLKNGFHEHVRKCLLTAPKERKKKKEKMGPPIVTSGSEKTSLRISSVHCGRMRRRWNAVDRSPCWEL